MNLHSLSRDPGKKKNVRRKGRGQGSNKGRTAGRGTKGQHARNTVRLGFEGGQTPLYRRLPHRRGFTRLGDEYAVFNVSQLECFDSGASVSPDDLKTAGIIKSVKNGVRCLGNGTLTKKLTVSAHHFSAAARKKIEAAGGTCEVLAK
jgi:large subunit ribosomal protein L15